jgi:hypothetical protein
MPPAAIPERLAATIYRRILMRKPKMKLFIAYSFIIVTILMEGCDCSGIYQAGSGLGSVAEVENYKYKQSFYAKYADTFLQKFPQYRVPDNDPSADMTRGYEFLNMTKFYFDKNPKEIYCVQWQGISVRMAYSINRGSGDYRKSKAKCFN